MKEDKEPREYLTSREACDLVGYSRPDALLRAWRAAGVQARFGAHACRGCGPSRRWHARCGAFDTTWATSLASRWGLAPQVRSPNRGYRFRPWRAVEGSGLEIRRFRHVRVFIASISGFPA